MHKPITEEKMASDIRKAKRFNDIAFIITVIFAVALITFLCVTHRYTTFSSKRWKADQKHRSYMLGSLLSEHKLYDMKKDELIELLGYDQHKWDMAETEQLTYYLGRSAITGAENWLILDLQNDKVTGYEFHTE